MDNNPGLTEQQKSDVKAIIDSALMGFKTSLKNELEFLHELINNPQIKESLNIKKDIKPQKVTPPHSENEPIETPDTEKNRPKTSRPMEKKQMSGKVQPTKKPAKREEKKQIGAGKSRTSGLKGISKTEDKEKSGEKPKLSDEKLPEIKEAESEKKEIQKNEEPTRKDDETKKIEEKHEPKPEKQEKIEQEKPAEPQKAPEPEKKPEKPIEPEHHETLKQAEMPQKEEKKKPAAAEMKKGGVKKIPSDKKVEEKPKQAKKPRVPTFKKGAENKEDETAKEAAKNTAEEVVEKVAKEMGEKGEEKEEEGKKDEKEEKGKIKGGRKVEEKKGKLKGKEMKPKQMKHVEESHA